MPLKFVTVNDNVFQLLQTPYRGAAPGPRWGTSVPRPPRLCSSKISLKNPLPRLIGATLWAVVTLRTMSA